MHVTRPDDDDGFNLGGSLLVRDRLSLTLRGAFAFGDVEPRRSTTPSSHTAEISDRVGPRRIRSFGDSTHLFLAGLAL